MPTVVALSCVGVFAVNASALDLVLMTLLGLVGYGMRKTGFPLAIALWILAAVSLFSPLLPRKGMWVKGR